MIGPATALSLGAAIACAALPPPVQRLAGEPGGNVQADMERMIRFNEEMLAAGILKSADGLKPSRFGRRVTFRRGGEKAVTSWSTP